MGGRKGYVADICAESISPSKHAQEHGERQDKAGKRRALRQSDKYVRLFFINLFIDSQYMHASTMDRYHVFCL